MSGDLSTTKRACCTWALRTRPTLSQRAEHALRGRGAGADVRRFATGPAAPGQCCPCPPATRRPSGPRHSPARPASGPPRWSRRVRTARTPRSRRHRAVGDRVGVDGDEQVRLRGPGAPDAFAQRHELIAIARQHGAHARLASMRRASARAMASTTSFSCAPAMSGRAGVLATVTGIHRDDDVAVPAPGACAASTT